MATTTPGAKRPYTRYGISKRDFVKTWRACQTVEEFCEKTGMSRSAASSRAAYYRSTTGLRRMPGAKSRRIM